VATGVAVQRDKTRDLHRHRRVVSLSEMEELLSETTGPFLRWEGKSVERVTYLLDQVNEDLKIDSINAIKQSLLFQEKFGGRVAILCRDVKVSADGMERLYRKAREQGALFFKYDEPPQVFPEEDLIRIDVKDTAAIHKDERWPVSIPSDLLIVGEALVPNPETEHLSQLLKIHIGDRGFLMEDNPQLLRVRSNRRGVFVAGGCRFPQEISESLIEARALVQEVVGLLSGGSYTFDLAVAEVDPKKCAVCYTCPRLCPHSAITIEKYAERNTYAPPGAGGGTDWGAARVDPVACYGCGICVAECPAKAITLLHLRDEQIYAQMNLTE
jgi:heterodisulfide reductase subunit A